MMAEATWGGPTAGTHIDWKMSAALENVPRGDSDLPEVANLETAVRAWLDLDLEHRIHARLTTEHPITSKAFRPPFSPAMPSRSS